MFKKLDQRINLALTLAIISGVSALLLASVNNITSPVISENLDDETLELYSELLPEMTAFNELESSDNVDSVVAVEKDSEVLGIVVSASGTNSYGAITVLVGIDLEGNIVGVEYSNFNQTPGFGDKVKEPSYIESNYIGDTIIDVSADVASGATYSSNLVIDLVTLCSAEAQEVLEELTAEVE